MDYVHNYAQIGAYSSQSMPAVQVFYPEMVGGKAFNEGSVPESCIPYDETYYNKSDTKSQSCTPVDLNDFYDGGDFKENGKLGAPVDLNHFYDGGDFKHPNNRDSHIVNYGSQHYVSPGTSMQSPSSYRCVARQNRQNREMNLRNGLYEPCGNNNNQNAFPTYKDNYTYPNRHNSYW